MRGRVASKGSTFLQPETNLYTMLPNPDPTPKAIAQDVAQAMHLMNGDTLLRKMAASLVLERLTRSKVCPRQIVSELYLQTLGREPAARELDAFTQTCGENPGRKEYEHLGWMLEEAHGGELAPGVASREPGLASRMQNPFSHQICHGSAFLTVGIDLDERFRPRSVPL